MRNWELSEMESVAGSGWFEDVTIGLACAGTIVLAASLVAAPLAVFTGPVCIVGGIGYALGKY